jgi:hypothetical protein
MQKWIETRSERLAAFFGRPLDTCGLADEAVMPEISTEMEQHLGRLNFEWHIIPTNEVMPLDEAYYDRLYLMRPPYFSSGRTHSRSIRSMFESGHARHQGQIIAVETTMKPRYLPGNHQAYGTQYGFDSTVDPLREYLDHGTRYAHNYTSLRNLGERVNQDLRKPKPPSERIPAHALSSGGVQSDWQCVSSGMEQKQNRWSLASTATITATRPATPWVRISPATFLRSRSRNPCGMDPPRLSNRVASRLTAVSAKPLVCLSQLECNQSSAVPRASFDFDFASASTLRAAFSMISATTLGCDT